jgi:hypothetical protein
VYPSQSTSSVSPTLGSSPVPSRMSAQSTAQHSNSSFTSVWPTTSCKKQGHAGLCQQLLSQLRGSCTATACACMNHVIHFTEQSSAWLNTMCCQLTASMKLLCQAHLAGTFLFQREIICSAAPQLVLHHLPAGLLACLPTFVLQPAGCHLIVWVTTQRKHNFHSI